MPDSDVSVAAAALAAHEVHVSATSSNVPEPAGTNFTESFAELEKAMGVEDPKEVPKADPKPKSTAATANKKSDQKTADGEATAEKKDFLSAKDAKESKESAEESNGKPLPAPELRRAYQELKAKHAQLQSEYETFKKTPREDPQAKTLSEKLAAAEKHRQQLDEELRNTAYERSQEFKDRYHTPFLNAYELASETASQLQATDREGNVRQGTKEDFEHFMQIENANLAKEWAENTWGPTGAAIMFNQRMEVVKAARHRNAALQEAKQTAGEREKMRQEADMAQRKALAEKWSKLNNEAAEKYPDWFKETEGDDKGNELLRKGREFAQMAFNGHNLSPEQQVELHSALYNRAAAFGRTAYQLKQARKENEELKAKLKEFEASEPAAAEGKADKAEPGELDWERQLESNWR